MADAEDLKSSGDFSSCGFDSHPGHHFSSFIFSWLMSSFLLRNRRVTTDSPCTMESLAQALSKFAKTSLPVTNDISL
jgi:hypothetical protein